MEKKIDTANKDMRNIFLIETPSLSRYQTTPLLANLPDAP